MKRRNDPRHLKRIKLMQELFAWDFSQHKKPSPELARIIDHLPELNQIIQSVAPERPIKQINKIDLSILRLAIFEVIIEKDIPPKVVIDEAVELAKEYGSESSANFINGCLGKLMTLKQINTSK